MNFYLSINTAPIANHNINIPHNVSLNISNYIDNS